MKTIRVLSLVGFVLAAALLSHAQTPTNGLVAYYPFNGTAHDASGNGNNGAITNAALGADRFGVVNSAYSFNGQNSQIIVNDNAALGSLTSNYTFNVWARFASAPSLDSCLLIKSAGAGAQRKWTFWRHVQASPLGIGVLLFRPSDGQYQWNNNYPFTSNRWYMLTFSASGTNCAIAVDGVVVSVQAGNMTLPDTTGLPLSMGGAESGGYQWFNGSLDDIRIYSRALSSNEVQQLYQAESSPPPPILNDGVIYVANQGSGNVRTFALTNGADLGLFATNIAAAHGIALDAAGNVYVASLTDNYIRRFSPSGVDLGIFAANGKNPSPADLIGWWPAEGNAADVTGNHNGIITTQFLGSVSFSPGKVGTAFDFSGTNFVEIQPFPLTNFTIECWLNQRTRVPVTPNSSWGCFLISDEVCGVQDDWHLGLLNGGQLLFHIGDGSGGVDYQFPSTNTIPLNTYVHVAVTRSTVTGKIELYLNGVLDSTFTAPHNRVVGMANPDCDIYPNTIGIGNIRRHAALGVSNHFDGLIDEPAIYNRALSAAEIAAIYNASSAGINSPRGLVFDTNGSLYVANYGNNSVHRYSSTGANLGPFITNGLANPTGMAFDDSGNLYVANYDLNQVKKFAPNGDFLGTVISNGLSQPVGLVVLPNNGGFYVANDFASSVIRYDANGTIVSSLTSGTLGRLFYLASDAGGNLYVTRVTGNAVRKFSPTGQDLGDIATTGMNIPAGIAIRQSEPASPAPVVILGQPSNQQRTVGANAAFVVVADGAHPLFYQWSFNGTNLVDGGRISGATSAQLGISNVQLSDAGSYSVVVSNVVNSVVSSNATLTVTHPPAVVSVVSTTNAAGGLVTVPVRLIANGNENALGFSLTIGTQPLPAVLTFDSVTLGSNAAGASLLVNTNQLGSRRIGVAIALPAGNTFAAGTQEVVQVRFQSTVLVGPPSRIISLTFGDQPTIRQLVSTNATILPATYANGSVTLTPSDIEGDSVPRPNGDRVAGITDWVQIGRFVALLDTPAAGGEFQRADCAPKEVLGDGLIKITDWVQAGRYAAGLDPLRAVGGPTSPSLLLLRNNEVAGASSERDLRTLGSAVYPGQTISVPVVLESQGDENALSFSVAFNPAVLSYAGIVPGSDGMTLSTNINTSQISSGKLGIVVGLSANNTFASGPRELLKVNLVVLPAIVAGSYPIELGNQPVLRGISNPSAGELASTYTAGTLSVVLPSLQIAKSGQNITLSWPAAAGDFMLQTSSDGLLPGVAWTNVPGVLQTNGGTISITLPLGEHSGFYRLHKP